MFNFTFVERQDGGNIPVACTGYDPGTRIEAVLRDITSLTMDKLRRKAPTMPSEERRELLRQWATHQEACYHGGPAYGTAGYDRQRERTTWCYANGLGGEGRFLLREEKGLLTAFVQTENHFLQPLMDETFQIPSHFAYVVSQLQKAGRHLTVVGDRELELEAWSARPNRGGTWLVLCGAVEELDKQSRSWDDKGISCWSRETKVRLKPNTVVQYKEYGISGWVNGEVWTAASTKFYVNGNVQV